VTAPRVVSCGASCLVEQNVLRNFDIKRATALLDKALSLPGV
jgi:hypothetical protein